ncbi:hypothetical protein [Microcoleus sp.]|uniref:hypothetical protein n=1 Tax=Microcoleus sp. TaxID=44472 RepID=UPI0035241C5A
MAVQEKSESRNDKGTSMASIRELHRQLVNKERSALEITQEALDRITQLEPKLKSFLCVTADRATAPIKLRLKWLVNYDSWD